MIKVTKIKEECKEYSRVYYKLEQVKTYKPEIVNRIIEQTAEPIKNGTLVGELGHNNDTPEINPMNITHKIISIEKLNDTDIKIISYVYPGGGMTKILHPILIACVEDKTFEIPLSYTLRGHGNSTNDFDNFQIVTFDLADETTVGKDPVFVPNTLMNDIALEQAAM